MKFKDLKLAHKQIVVFGLILLIMAFVGAFSLKKISSLKTDIDAVSNNWLPKALAISELNDNTSDLRANQLQYVLTSDLTKREELKKNIILLIDETIKNDSVLENLENENIFSETEKQLYNNYKDNWENYLALSIQFFDLVDGNRNEEAIELLNNEALELFNLMNNNLDELVIISESNVFAATQRAEKAFHATRGNTLFLFTITIIIAVLSISALVRFITQPVHLLEKAAMDVANGNLDVQVDLKRKDEVGNLARSFDQMTVSLKASKEKTEKQAKALLDQAKMLKVANNDLAEKNLQLETTLRELKNTQEQLLLKEKMASLGDLVAGVAHEINNPIGTVNSSIDVSDRCIEKIEIVLQKSESIAELKSNQDLPDAINILKENIKVTMSAGDRIAKIVKSLKNFATLDESDYQKVDIHSGLDSTLTLIEGEFQGRIKVNKEYGKIPRIVCYPSQLNQVFMNLLKNSVNAIEGVGTIGIKTRQENSYIQIQISDTGKGIPKDRLKNIFEFGFSSSESRVKMSSGLSSAYNIIQKHNGDIWVDSKEGRGTTFFINLPIA
jgi:signal transduction histidine kinase